MPDKKTRERATGRVGRRTGVTIRTKERPVTQSTRFTPQQMQEIEKACKLKGWSISQLMLMGTLEKAVAINQMSEKSRLVSWCARALAQALHGTAPQIRYKGGELADPQNPYAGWKEDECSDGPWLELPGGEHYATFDPDCRRIGILNRCPGPDENEDAAEVPIVEVAPQPVSRAAVQNILDCVAALGTELAPVLRESYSSLLMETSGRGQQKPEEKLRTAGDLLKGEEASGEQS